MTVLFLIAGVMVGYRCSVMALVVALPLSVVAAAGVSVAGLIAPGFGPVLLLCVIFEFGFFGGCILHSRAVDKAAERGRFADKSPGPSR